jgi:uncharacterized protein (DUF2141 family)
MRKSSLCILGIILSIGSVFSQYKLNIIIESTRNDEGNIMLQLFNSTENVIQQEIGQIKDGKCIFEIPDLKQGQYAVRYYHDENSNGKMETNLVGKPTEGYGFSNNVTGRFGPPPFEKWLFKINHDMEIYLKPVY